MKLLRFDSVGGASGDLILGALLDLGVPVDAIQVPLNNLGIGNVELVPEPGVYHGWHGTRLTVHVVKEPDTRACNLETIRFLLRNGPLPERTRRLSECTFERLAGAEAQVHGIHPQDVHFHEVGAADAIADIVGNCLALEWLGIEGVWVGPLPQGVGTVVCRHGTLPNPPPAVVELLKGHPIELTTENAELVTPTAAALLMTWKTECASVPDSSCGTVLGYGCGMGHYRLVDRPNLLRVVLLDCPSPEARVADTYHVLVLECEVDDLTPEMFGALLDRLLAQGALDAYFTPIQMKKQRPAILLTVLTRPPDRDALLDIIFRESTTFGVREYRARRTLLPRRQVAVKTAYGVIRVKFGTWKGVTVTRAPEFEDCLLASREHRVPLRRVYEAALLALENES